MTARVLVCVSCDPVITIPVTANAGPPSTVCSMGQPRPVVDSHVRCGDWGSNPVRRWCGIALVRGCEWEKQWQRLNVDSMLDCAGSDPTRVQIPLGFRSHSGPDPTRVQIPLGFRSHSGPDPTRVQIPLGFSRSHSGPDLTRVQIPPDAPRQGLCTSPTACPR